MNTESRCRGALFGLAVGDALGAAVEFKRPGSFEPVTGYRAGGPHGLEPGEWTDDTSMALAMADSIWRVGWDLSDQMRRYLDWWDRGEYSVNGRCFDIGNTTARSLRSFRRFGDPKSSGSQHERDSGNGSIMRLAPVPIKYRDLYPDKMFDLIVLASESSLPTHASQQCISACRYLAVVLAALINGEPREKVLDPEWETLAALRRFNLLDSAIEDVARGSYRRKSEIKGSGYVVNSLEAALWAFHDAADFREAGCGPSTWVTTPTRRVRCAGSWPARTGEFRRNGWTGWPGRR